MAGKRHSASILRQIISHLKVSGYNHTVFRNNWPVNFAGFTEIWLIGGDGTLNYFINHFQFDDIPLAIFKGGTGNDFAWKLYGNISTYDQINLVLHSNAKPVDAGICNGHYFLNTVGIGFDGKVLGLMNTIRLLGSTLGYYLAVVKNIFSFREPDFLISCKQQIIKSGKLLLCQVSNAPRTGGGFLLSPLADPADGWLNLLCCSPLQVTERIQLLSRVKHGQHIGLPVITHQLIDQVTIRSNCILPAQLDGELIRAETFEISIARQKFMFFY